jgi:hypothetical protein
VAEQPETTGSQGSERPTSVVSELCRMIWLIYGAVGLLFTAGAIAGRPAWTYSVRDYIYWGIFVVMVLARFLDIAFLRGRTANHEPAAMRHWIRYCARLTVVAALVWTGAQSIQM